MSSINLESFSDELTKIAKQEKSELAKALLKFLSGPAPKKGPKPAERAIRRAAKRKSRSLGRRGRAKLREAAIGEA